MDGYHGLPAQDSLAMAEAKADRLGRSVGYFVIGYSAPHQFPALRKGLFSAFSLSESPVRLPFCPAMLEKVLLLHQRAETGLGESAWCSSAAIRDRCG